MYPYSNYSASLLPFEAVSSQSYQNQYFDNTFPSFGNYYYFPHPSYFQPNINFGQFPQSTLFKDITSGNFRVFQDEQLQKIAKIPNVKNNSSSTTE